MNAIDAILAPLYKWLILSLLLVFGGYVVYCNSLAKDLRLAEANCKARIEKEIKPYLDAVTEAEKKADLASEKYEKVKTLEQGKSEVINNKIETIKERTIYRNVCLDTDGVSVLNEAGQLEYPP